MLLLLLQRKQSAWTCVHIGRATVVIQMSTLTSVVTQMSLLLLLLQVFLKTAEGKAFAADI